MPRPIHQFDSPQPTPLVNTPTPRIVFWETTGACNLSCIHCRREWSSTRPNELSTAEAKHLLIDTIANAKWHSIIVFSGGEPLIRSDIFDLIAYTKQRDLTPALATNATLIDKTVAQKLAQLGVSRVSVSLDGATEHTHDSFRNIPGSFHDAVRGIKALRTEGIHVQINVTITKLNSDEARAMLDTVRTLDACALHVFLLVPVGCGAQLPDSVRLDPSEVEQILTLFDDQATEHDIEIRATCAPQAQRIRQQRAVYRKQQSLPEGRGLARSSKGCLAGGGIIFVDAIGRVFPCGYLPLPVGDLRTQPLTAVLAQSELLASLRDVTMLQEGCHDCSFNQCCGGCRARAFGTSNNVFGAEPSCIMNSSHSANRHD